MGISLVEAAKLSETKLQRGIIETFIQEGAVLDRIPLKPIDGNAYAYNKEATLPGIEFRAVNGSYTESTGTVVQATETLSILGGDSDVDTFIQATRSDVNDQRATQDRLKVKAATYKFQDTFINGDVAVDTNAFDGLKKRLTGSQVIDAATNGLPVIGASSSDRHAFFDKLDELLDALNGEADALYMRKAIRAKIRSSARREGFYAADRDEFGRKVETYNDVPMLDLGTNAAGTEIIPQTETQGTATGICSSIYAVRFGQDEADQAVTGLTNGGVSVRDLGEQQAKPALRTRVEFFVGLATFGGQGAARLRGVLNS